MALGPTPDLQRSLQNDCETVVDTSRYKCIDLYRLGPGAAQRLCNPPKLLPHPPLCSRSCMPCGGVLCTCADSRDDMYRESILVDTLCIDLYRLIIQRPSAALSIDSACCGACRAPSHCLIAGCSLLGCLLLLLLGLLLLLLLLRRARRNR